MEGSGSWISFEGSLKRDSIWVACSECGVTARRLVGRLLRGSALVGMDSRPGSDILVFGDFERQIDVVLRGCCGKALWWVEVALRSPFLLELGAWWRWMIVGSEYLSCCSCQQASLPCFRLVQG